MVACTHARLYVAGPGPQPVTYGSEIVLADTVSGTQTAPLIIRKVDKGRIAADDGGPVSQMQKIALQRINADGTRQYLSAAGPTPGTPGVVTPPTPGLSNQAGSHPLLFQAPRIREEVKDGNHVIIDEVDDYLCWTIVGICAYLGFVFNFTLLTRVIQLNSNIHFSMHLDKIALSPSYPSHRSLRCSQHLFFASCLTG